MLATRHVSGTSGPLEACKGWSSHQSDNKGHAAVKSVSAPSAEKFGPILWARVHEVSGAMHASLAFKSRVACHLLPMALGPAPVASPITLETPYTFHREYGIFKNIQLITAQ